MSGPQQKEIPYWWSKICPESGQELWLVNVVITLFMNDKQKTNVSRSKVNVNVGDDESTTMQSLFVEYQ